MANQPAESPEAIAERLLPCVDAGNCGEWGHYDDCPVNLRPAVATALQAERERALKLETALKLAVNAGDALVKMVRKLEDASGQFISSVHFHQAKDNIEACRALAQKGGGA